jgi:23S rRNA (cytosine1962-C5)-methyltransferase
MKTVRLVPGRERSLLRRHPWVFAGSVAKGGGDPGETVRVESAEGAFLAWAAIAPASQIRLRAWSFEERERIDAAFFRRRVEAAVARRAGLGIDSDALRLVHGESDGLPGLVVDRYGDTLVAQFGSSGAERWKAAIVDALVAATGAARVHERSDTASREREGLPAAEGWLHGGDGAPTALEIREGAWRFGLDVAGGHKTGFYLDQRDNRRWFAEAVRRRGLRRVLNGHAYTGGFAVAALAGGAEHVLSVDSSGPSLARAAENVARNGFDAARHATLDADMNRTLRAFAAEGRRFDAIVLDPPKLAPTVAHAERAARAYKDLNRLALGLLAPGGLLLTFSCSAGVDAALFHKIVAGAAIDAGVDGDVEARLAASPDHPTTLLFPEGDYLKGLAVVRRRPE